MKKRTLLILLVLLISTASLVFSASEVLPSLTGKWISTFRGSQAVVEFQPAEAGYFLDVAGKRVAALIIDDKMYVFKE